MLLCILQTLTKISIAHILFRILIFCGKYITCFIIARIFNCVFDMHRMSCNMQFFINHANLMIDIIDFSFLYSTFFYSHDRVHYN